MRYAHLGGGETYNNVLKKSLSLGQSLETYVDENQDFSSCTLDWANNTFDVGAEALYHNKRFFVRGEYRHKLVTKSVTLKRSSRLLTTTSTHGARSVHGRLPTPANQPL